MPLKIIAKYLAVFLCVLSAYYAPSVLSEHVSIPYEQTVKSNGDLSITLSRALNAGEEVFFSAGRPRGPCRLLDQSENILFSNTGNRVGKAAEPLDELFVGGTLVASGGENSFLWRCDVLGGFGPKREFDISFASRNLGFGLFAATMFVDGFVGAFISTLMLLLGLYFFIKGKRINDFVFLGFAFATFLYNFSISNLTHLVFSQSFSFYIHVNLYFISRALLAVWMVNPDSRKKFFGTLVVVEAAFLVACVLLRQEQSVSLYRNLYTVFTPVLAFSCWFFSSGVKRNVVYVWLPLALVDSLVLYFGFGKYPAPIAFACLNCYIAFTHYKQDYFLTAREKFVSHLASLIPSYTSFENFLSDLSSKTWIFSNVKPIGYFLDKSFHDPDLKFGTEKIFINNSSSEGSFRPNAVLNFEPFGGVHFNVDSPFSRELISTLESGVQSLSKIYTHLVFPEGDGYQPIIKKFGQGVHKGTVASCVIDINDYSVQTEKFGEVYRNLVLKKIIPLLRDCFGDEWVVESSRGDEVVAFFVESELNQARVTKELERVLVTLFDLKANILPKISSDQGFDAISISVGFCHGETSIMIDPMGVRLASSAINTAKRLQERATKGSFLISDSTAQFLETSEASSNLKMSAPFDMIVKKNLVKARKILVA